MRPQESDGIIVKATISIAMTTSVVHKYNINTINWIKITVYLPLKK